MAYYPRKYSKRIVGRIRNWPLWVSDVKLLGFVGYKVGMVHLFRIDNNPNSPFYGREIFCPATILEAPPLLVGGLRFYSNNQYGLKIFKEIWAEELPKNVFRKIPQIKTSSKGVSKVAKKEIMDNLSNISEVRAICITQPWLTHIGKKTPEIMEIPISGDKLNATELGFNIIGKEIRIKDVFRSGQYVDVISITKGKGFEGVIKRFGVKILPRWHKHRKGHRRIGSVGPTKPAIMFTTPRPGQTGFHQRTEYNKLVLKIGEDPNEVNPKGGFKHYGVIRNDFIILEGSIPGAIKRLIRLREPIRAKSPMKEPPKITYISIR